MRNPERDELEMSERRERILETGFRIFAEKGIEAVAMQDVAATCGVGIATLYRYFSTKPAFVIAIGAKKWEEYFREIEAEYERRGGDLMNAAEELDFYLGCYIALYREQPDVLRFNQNFNGYVQHEQVTRAQLQDYLRAIESFSVKFHKLYEKGVRDGSIRTDEPEQTMFHTTMHIMLAACGRYAQGVLIRTDDPEDLTRELMILKRMILNQYTVK
ncbi:MAG: TetR/AcrR family transcriptional regulator [Oscillospiraceae bacterium]|nr:TetR/AcrR family transcriptional regulator [Oscillospiraceae bacterium]